MKVELFGIARARAGCESVEVEAGTLGEALRALATACPALSPDVILDGELADAFLVSLNGERFIRDRTTELAEQDALLILGAQMGG
ncbi:MAG: MoaD/ThiS family protein [Planctomycetota bacterium]